MASEPITFMCAVCDSKLTVPGNLAGETGPCPTCQSMTQVPSAVTHLASDSPFFAPSVFKASPAALRPEPRQVPGRHHSKVGFTRQMPTPNFSGQPISEIHEPPQDDRPKKRLSRFVKAVMFVMAALAIGLLSTTLLKRQAKSASSKGLVKSPSSRPILQELAPPRSLQVSKTRSNPLISATASSSAFDAVPVLPVGLEAKTPSEVSKEVLDQFLAAKTLGERLPLMETQTPESELSKSCLAGPLPEARNFLIGAVENNAVEQVADFYHHLDFEADGSGVNPQTILVRIRGSAPPKVVVDPFLDSYGGRLFAYAKSPSDKAGFFQVIVWPLAACYDERVPNFEKKLTLKLLPQAHAKEIAVAYVGRQSKIAQMLADGNYSVAYNKAKACTVMLRWNIEDNPSLPYLEAVALKTLDWNP